MCLFCSFQETLEEIESMLNDDNHHYAWAFDTLDGIKETIERTQHVTEKQRRAITNIGKKR